MMKAKKWLAVVLAVLTLTSLAAFAPAAQAAGVSEQTAQQVVSALGIMVGDGTGNMNLDGTLTRSQMAKVLVKLSGYSAQSAATSPFPDVPYTNWAAPYVSRAVSLGYINGCPDGTFKPDQNTKPEEMAKTLLAVLGYTSADFGVGYPWAQVNYAQKLGLFSGVTSQVGSDITRRDMMLMVYNALNATAKNGKKYITALGYGTTASGDIDVSSLISANSVGPVTVKSSAWYQGTGLNTAYTSVYLNDRLSTLSAVQPNDIAYYSVSMNTIWAYDRKVTGILQSALPSRLSPTSVVVSGTTYTLGSSAATTAAGYSGTINIGDTVTLLLGRDGSVADIIPAAASVSVTGYVTASGSKTYTNADGSTYSSYYVTLLSVDGSKMEYQLSFDPSSYVDHVISIVFSNGVAQMAGINSSALSGTVSYPAMMIGGQRMSPDIKILDVDSYGNYVTVYPQRLDGLSLSSANILFCQTDSTGAVTQLILKGATGDTSSYGILTGVTAQSQSMSISGTYSYNIAGTTGTYKTNAIYNVSVGPAAFTTQNGTIAAITPLTSLGSVTLTGGNAVVSSYGHTYLLSDKAMVYKSAADGTYTVIPVSSAAGMNLTAYYDKTESDGGRIRVLIAQ